jgi:hypothetical protein
MTNAEIIETLDILADCFKKYNEMLDAIESRVSVSVAA